jgi:hypothetical protein
VPQRSAEGKVGHAVGEDIEALHKPKGGATDRPSRERCPKAPNGREWRVNRAISGTTRGRKANSLAFRIPGGVKLQGASTKGTESLSGDALYRKPGYSHLAQPAEPPYADPHVRWCGRGGRVPLSRLQGRAPSPAPPKRSEAFWRHAVFHRPNL